MLTVMLKYEDMARSAGGTGGPALCPSCGERAEFCTLVEPIGDRNEVQLIGFACSACDHEFMIA
jgi:C4-type Zn-finger protein